MLLCRNTADTDIAAGGALVPLDRTVYSTNDAVALEENTLKIYSEGIYSTECEVVVSNSGSSAVTVSLKQYDDGLAVPGAIATATVANGATATLTLPFAVKVVGASSGVAKVNWMIGGGAVTVTNATARIHKHI